MTSTSTTHLSGDELRARRKALGLSQARLAAKLHVHTNTVARWERGELVIEHPNMILLALDELARQQAPPPHSMNDRILANLAYSYADMIQRGLYDAGNPDDPTSAAIADALNRGLSVDIRFGGEGAGWWTRVENFWIGHDEAERFSRMVRYLAERPVEEWPHDDRGNDALLDVIV